jgi:hypothetical protein
MHGCSHAVHHNIPCKHLTLQPAHITPLRTMHLASARMTTLHCRTHAVNPPTKPRLWQALPALWRRITKTKLPEHKLLYSEHEVRPDALEEDVEGKEADERHACGPGLGAGPLRIVVLCSKAVYGGGKQQLVRARHAWELRLRACMLADGVYTSAVPWMHHHHHHHQQQQQQQQQQQRSCGLCHAWVRAAH